MQPNYYDNLSEAIEDLNERGFTGQFAFENDQLVDTQSDNTYEAKELEIVEYHRFEGDSKPVESAVVFAIAKKAADNTEDTTKGTIVMNYSIDADMDLVSFIDKVKIKQSTAEAV